ncbi:hypothetical protein KH388_21520 [Serratia rubidaea]|nr:hypothetical protein [Serratia rubidaea]
MVQAVVPAFKNTKTLQDGTTIDPMTGEIIPMPESGSNSALRDAAPAPGKNPDGEGVSRKFSDDAVVDFKQGKELVTGKRENETYGGVELTLHSPEWESLVHSIMSVEYITDNGEWRTKDLTATDKKVYSGILRLYKLQGDDMQTITLNSTEIGRECGITLGRISNALKSLSCCFLGFNRNGRGYFIRLSAPTSVLKSVKAVVQDYTDINSDYVRSRYGKQPAQKPDLKVVNVD